MKHRKVSDPFDGWSAVVAALVILFCSMVEPHVALTLSVGVAIIFATIKIIQSRKSY